MILGFPVASTISAAFSRCESKPFTVWFMMSTAYLKNTVDPPLMVLKYESLMATMAFTGTAAALVFKNPDFTCGISIEDDFVKSISKILMYCLDSKSWGK